MSGIGPGEISEGISNVYNLVISTESAQILANELNKKEWWENLSVWAPMIAAFLSVITAIISIYIAWKSNKNSLKIQKTSLKISKNSTKIAHDSLVNNIYRLYFDIKTQNVPDPMKIRLYCSFFEYVCDFRYKNILKEIDLSFLSGVLLDPPLVNYAISEYKKDNEVYCQYIKWLKTNGIKIK